MTSSTSETNYSTESHSQEQLSTSYPVEELVRCYHDIEGELKRFLQKHLPARSRQLANPHFYNSAQDYVMRPSKRLVSFVYLLSHNVFDMSAPLGDQQILPVAVALEIRHAAILIHDDIVDQDDRRGPILTAHKALEQQGYGNDGAGAALFLADALFALAELALVESHLGDTIKVNLLRHFLDLNARMAEGQADEIFLTNSYDLEQVTQEQLYEAYIGKMSPATIECSIVLGAITAGASEAAVETIRSFCQPISLAYQIQNDIAGYENLLKVLHSGGTFVPLASTTDFDRRRKTLLLKVARDLSSLSGRTIIDDFVAGGQESTVNDVLDAVAQSGAIPKLNQEVERLFLRGRELIEQSALDSPTKSGLLRICRFMNELYDSKSPLSRIHVLAHPELQTMR